MSNISDHSSAAKATILPADGELQGFEDALKAVRKAHGAWVQRAVFNAADVGLLRHALRRIADATGGDARGIARDALAKLAEDEASRERRGALKAGGQ